MWGGKGVINREDEKRQFTINVSNVNGHEGTVREMMEEQKKEEEKEEKELGLVDLIQQLGGKVKVPVAALLFMLIVGGILLTYLPEKKVEEVMSGNVVGETATNQKSNLSSTSTLAYEELLEMRMETILTSLEGAGVTKVMVTTSGSTEKVLAEEVVQNSLDIDETTQAGNKKTSEKQDIERKIVKEKGDTPFVVKETKPQVEGVLVLAQGADDVNIKNAIIQSVSSLLDVPVHKIAVYKMSDTSLIDVK